MAQITQSFLKNRLQLGFENYVRPFVWGTNWREIRVGVRLAVNDTLTGLYNTSFLMGITAGPYGWDTPTTVDAIAMQVGAGSWDAYSPGRVTSGGQPCYLYSGCMAARKQGVTVTSTISNAAQQGFLAITQTGILTGFITSFVKLPTLYSMQSLASSTCTSLSTGDLAQALENPTAIIPGFSNFANRQIAYPATSHPFDHLLLRWNKCIPSMDIAEILVTRHY